MKKIQLFVVAFAVITMSGCASVSGWQPTVDAYGDPNAANLSFDMNQCQQLAKQSSSFVSETAMGTGVGALVGGGGGAAVGALIGDPAVGAALGAAVAGIGGGAYSGIKADDKYKSTYISCMRNRRHNVVG